MGPWVGVWSWVSNIEEHRLKVFDNCVLWETFGSKRGEMTRQWSIPHSEKLQDIRFSSIIIRVIKSIRMTLWGTEKVYTGFWWEKLRGSPLGIPRRKWEEFSFISSPVF
jgi:hypothetical protein